MANLTPPVQTHESHPESASAGKEHEQSDKHRTPRWMWYLAIIAVVIEVTLAVVWLLWRYWQKRKED